MQKYVMTYCKIVVTYSCIYEFWRCDVNKYHFFLHDELHLCFRVFLPMIEPSQYIKIILYVKSTNINAK